MPFGPHNSPLVNRFRGMTSRQKAYEKYQVLSRSMEDALLQWASELDAQGFPPRLDLFKAMAAELATSQQTAETPSLCSNLPANLGPTWIGGFLGRHPEF